MKTMKAMQFESKGSELKLVDRPIPEPKPNEVLIKVIACGICHGDAVVKEGHFPGLVYPRIPGHEVVGIIEKLGSKSDNWKIGDRVGVGWHGGHCFTCKACKRGDFGACENSLATGITIDGGYAEYMVARTESLVSIPDKLSSTDAAPLLCAGSTTFGALKNSNAKPGDLVAIQGIGGLGHLAIQYSKKFGFNTVAISQGSEKEELAKKLGANHYINTSKENPSEVLSRLGGAKLILCTAPNSKSISVLVNGLGPKGEIIIVSFSNEPLSFSPAQLMRGSKSIKGWVGGNIDDAIKFSVLTEVKPIIEVFPLKDAALAYDKMITSKVKFRSVLLIGDNKK